MPIVGDFHFWMGTSQMRWESVRYLSGMEVAFSNTSSFRW
jgi:hypothetical protein